MLYAVCPCCVFACDFPERRVPASGETVETLNQLVEWMTAKHLRMRTALLPFAGRNKVVYMLPEDYDGEPAGGGAADDLAAPPLQASAPAPAPPPPGAGAAERSETT